MTDQPTEQQLAALQAFADKYGRSWKTELAFAWMYGRDEHEPGACYLRQVRNHLGPSWLRDKCKIKPAPKAKRGA